MPTTRLDHAADFDDFYLASRRRLVLQAYALTGDLSAARSAVRDAFVAARHHWRKVGRLPDPEEWVRPRAWAMAQRRHVARLWHREKGHHRRAEERARRPAPPARPAAQGAAAGPPRRPHHTRASAASWARRPARVEEQLDRGDPRPSATETGTPSRRRPRRDRVARPDRRGDRTAPPAPIRRASGRRRRRLHAVGGVVVLLALTSPAACSSSGAGSSKPAAAADPEPAPKPVTEEMLLSLRAGAAAGPADPGGACSTPRTTPPAPASTPCARTTRFADPRGRGTFVRKFAAAGTTAAPPTSRPWRSRAPREAAADGVPDDAGLVRRLQRGPAPAARTPTACAGSARQAQMLKLRIPNDVRPHLRRRGRPHRLGDRLDRHRRRIDGRPIAVAPRRHGADRGRAQPLRRRPVGPLPDHGHGRAGAAAAVRRDARHARRRRPARRRHASTGPGSGPTRCRRRPNIAATTCDKANFVRAGAPRAATRTFLIPQAQAAQALRHHRDGRRLPRPAQGPRLRAHASRRRWRRCEKKDLGAEVSSEVAEPRGYRGSEYALWRLDSEINEHVDGGLLDGHRPGGPLRRPGELHADRWATTSTRTPSRR